MQARLTFEPCIGRADSKPVLLLEFAADPKSKFRSKGLVITDFKWGSECVPTVLTAGE